MQENVAKILVFIVDSIYGTERLGLEILIAIAKEENFDTYFFETVSIDQAELIRQIKEIKPDLIAYSAMTYEHNILHSLNKKLKAEFNFISIFGGPHYTFNPEEIYAHDHIDVICIGEGERAFRSFLKCLKDKRDYSNIPNLIIRSAGLIKKNPLGPLIDNLDEIPFADRKIILLDKNGHRHLGRASVIMIGRGCPYKCTYCFNVRYNEIYKNSRIIRWRSIENIILEMKKIKDEAETDHFVIADDTFNLLPKDYIYEFCRQYKKEISMPFSAQFRANLVDENVISALSDAGMKWANCGIETGDEMIANSVLQRRVTNQQIIKAFSIFNKYNIKNFSQNIVGLPVENPIDDAWKTILLNIKAKVGYAHFTILLPFPNTPIEQYCKAHGYLPSEWISQLHGLMPSVFTKTVLKFPNPKDNLRLTNLHKFCSIAVKFPFLIPLIKILIKLPPNRFFQYIYFFWYAYHRTVMPFKIKLSPALIFKGLKLISTYLKRYN